MLKTFCLERNIDAHGFSASVLGEAYRYDALETAKIKYCFNYIFSQKQKEQFFTQFMSKNMTESDFVDEWYVSEAELAEMDNMFECLASHAKSHTPLRTLGADQCFDELLTSKIFLENLVGREVFSISYPSGNLEAVSKREASMASKAGYKFGFTMERQINRSVHDPHLLARIDCNDLPTVGKFPRFKFDKDLVEIGGKPSHRKRYFDESQLP